ncbi:PaaX family transcriptional regulator C-terminal domain-containing protein [Citricoccus sp. NPDC055426]|uniref:PaaX family transcriptional regulator n=1 Tax=Citricoccus sp. NPDC055426 TaxID=3155536 RepID=UPI0034486CE7
MGGMMWDVWSNLEDLRSVVAEGPRGRRALVTLMAEYWLDEGSAAPSGALVDLMSALEVSPSGTRTLLSRLAREGRLTTIKEGRRTFYALSPKARHRLTEGFDVIRTFGTDHGPADPEWTTLLYSVPEEHRGVRQQLRKGLSWMWFAPLYDGAWVSPRPQGEQAIALCHKLGVESASLLRGRIDAAGTRFGNPVDAWDLDLARQLYTSFTAILRVPLERLHEGGLSPVESMRARTETINTFRGFPRFDPDLPLGLLTPDWPRRTAREAFAELYEGTTEASLAHVRSVVERHSPAHVQDVSVRRLTPAGGLASSA